MIIIGSLRSFLWVALRLFSLGTSVCIYMYIYRDVHQGLQKTIFWQMFDFFDFFDKVSSVLDIR